MIPQVLSQIGVARDKLATILANDFADVNPVGSDVDSIGQAILESRSLIEKASRRFPIAGTEPVKETAPVDNEECTEF